MSSNDGGDGAAVVSAEGERKRQRLLAWKRKKQQQQAAAAAPPPPAPKVSLSLGGQKKKKKTTSLAASTKKQKTKKKMSTSFNAFGDSDDADEDDDDDEEEKAFSSKRKMPTWDLEDEEEEKPSKRSRRWDTAPSATSSSRSSSGKTTEKKKTGEPPEKDALDQFMDKLEAGAMGNVTVGRDDILDDTSNSKMSIHVGGSILRKTHVALTTNNNSNNAITAEQLQNNDVPVYQPKDWLSDTHPDTEDEEDEEKARRALIEALAARPAPGSLSLAPEQQRQQGKTAEPKHHGGEEEGGGRGDNQDQPAQLASDVRTEKSRRQERLRQLERQAQEARQSAEAAAAPELGPLFNDVEAGVMEEAERNLQTAKAAPDALTVLAELNKKKELKAVDHSQVKYEPIQKNLYRVPRALANLPHDEVINRRAKLKVRVRGHGAPVPVSTFEECGLSERILRVLNQQEITKPFPIQAQCIPCIMAGRDVIGIAKTGSGKTLAYLLPLLRHILVQPPLAANESGPIGLILAPARELAYQIHSVCKGMAKQLGLRSTAVYGGAGVAEQIGDLKRGTHIVVATPGRLIDILTMQSGKMLSLHRVTYAVLDEADRMFDMGFAPQISAVLAAVRPDAQRVLFSATFPKAVESLARKSLKFPVEVVVGGRSVASDNITQYGELVEEQEKFLRLLQILGEQVEGTKKALVFVDTQVRADNLFEQLLRSGYSALSLHGGKEQEDRDSTVSDFKRKDGPNVLVATGVAGRGLDVPACCCVINYSAPNHLEAYVHQVGRTGRAAKKGVAYTFVSPTDEEKFAPIVVRAMSEAGQSENITPALKRLSDDFKSKVEKGEARYAGSGFKGKGYTYDSTEMNEAQKNVRVEKRRALIDAGLLDPDEEDPMLVESSKRSAEAPKSTAKTNDEQMQIEVPDNLTPELLALPGMKEALLRKAGIVPTEDKAEEEVNDPSQGRPVQMAGNHWLQEFDINDYPREARWKVTQKDTTSRMQDEFRTAVTLKGSYFAPGREPAEGERRLYLHLEATSETILRNAVLEIQRLLNEETLKVGARTAGGAGSHKYNVL